jgi:hypothetical protein
LCGELCEGLLPLRFVPSQMPWYRERVEEGFRHAKGGKYWDGFAIEATVPVCLTDDVEEALRAMKPDLALYVGGVGALDHQLSQAGNGTAGLSRGCGEDRRTLPRGRKEEQEEEEEAAAAVPDDFVDEQDLVGPSSRIRNRYRAWADSGLTGIHVSTQQAGAIELMAEVALRS